MQVTAFCSTGALSGEEGSILVVSCPDSFVGALWSVRPRYPLAVDILPEVVVQFVLPRPRFARTSRLGFGLMCLIRQPALITVAFDFTD
jgi:hypothetical protein